LVRRTAAASVVLLLPLLAACGGASSSTADDTAGSSPTATQSSSASGVTCDYPDAPQGKTGHATKPPTTPTVQGQVRVTIKTTIGDLGATLDADKTPCTVNSFVSLARQGFFDSSPCHRLTTAESGIYVLQCGDPTGTGTGRPGYTIQDEPVTAKYVRGTVAMARTSQPNSVGSQFFVVLDDKDQPILASANTYQIIGSVTKGMETVDAIYAAAGGVENPTNPVAMDKVRLSGPVAGGSAGPSTRSAAPSGAASPS